MSRIYLDHAATTPLRPEAREAMLRGFDIWANPSSPHAEGRKARAALEDARERVKKALGWDGEVIFTSGASEALAIGLGRAKTERRIVSAVEHDAVFRVAPGAEIVPIGAEWKVDREILARLLEGKAKSLVAVQEVNSETGTVQPVADIAAQVREAGGWLLADCSQSAGKRLIPTCDMAVVSAHKLGGPIGIGALLVRELAMLEPSGGHERGYRAGTENLPAALGFAAALEAGGLETWQTTYNERFDLLMEFEAQAQMPACGAQIDYIFPVTHPELSAQTALIRLDAMGFAVSAGSACSSGSLKPSKVLKAFGLEDERASRTIRVSIGWNTRPEELDAFADAWAALTAGA
jgi:cysteine desulfurase